MSAPGTKTGQFSVWSVWAMLTGASLAGYLLAEGAASARIAAIAAIVLAAVKINLIFGQYMDVTWAHRPLRSLLSLWLAIVTLILTVGYLTV